MSTENSLCVPFDIGYNPRWVHDCLRHLPLHDDGRCWLIQIGDTLRLTAAPPAHVLGNLVRNYRRCVCLDPPAPEPSERPMGMRWGVEHHRAHQQFWHPHITANEHPLNPRIFGDLDTDEDWDQTELPVSAHRGIPSSPVPRHRELRVYPLQTRRLW